MPPYLEEGDPNEPDLLESVSRQAKKVTFEDGQVVSVNLKLARVE